MDIHNTKPAHIYGILRTLFGERWETVIISYISFYNRRYRFLGDGLLTTLKYEVWRQRRKLYDPAFSKR